MRVHQTVGNGRFNAGQIHQFQSRHLDGASKQEAMVLRHATSAHTTANAHDPVVMNILKRAHAQRPVSPQEQQFLEKRLLQNEQLLAKLEARKHPKNVTYELEVEKNGASHVQEFVNGHAVYAVSPMIGGRSS